MTTPSTVARPSIAPGTYAIDPARSRVSFGATSFWGLFKARGTVRVSAGTIVVADDPAACSVRATLDVSTLDTGNRRRDKDLTGKNFLDVAAHPEWTFASTGGGPSAVGWTVEGRLTAHGVTAPVTLRLTAGRATPDGCSFTATAVLDRTAFGVTTATGFIGRHVTVAVEVMATVGN